MAQINVKNLYCRLDSRVMVLTNFGSMIPLTSSTRDSIFLLNMVRYLQLCSCTHFNCIYVIHIIYM